MMTLVQFVTLDSIGVIYAALAAGAVLRPLWSQLRHVVTFMRLSAAAVHN